MAPKLTPNLTPNSSLKKTPDSTLARNLYFLGPSICHISAAECHRITNYGSKFSGERVLTEYSKMTTQY
jgi:hypothetical protein